MLIKIHKSGEDVTQFLFFQLKQQIPDKLEKTQFHQMKRNLACY